MYYWKITSRCIQPFLLLLHVTLAPQPVSFPPPKFRRTPFAPPVVSSSVANPDEGKPRSPSSSARDKTSSSFSMSCAASPFQAPPPLFPAAAGLLPRFPSDRTPVAFPLQAARDSFFSPIRVCASIQPSGVACKPSYLLPFA